MSLWARLAHWILDNRTAILLMVALGTVVLGYWALQVKTDHTPGQFISQDSQVKQDFERVNALFGESQTVLYIVFEGADPYDPAFLSQLKALDDSVRTHAGVEHVLSLASVPILVRADSGLVPEPLFDPSLSATALRTRIEAQPFLRGLLLSLDGTTTTMLVDFAESFNNSAARVAFVTALVEQAEALPGDAAFAGFPFLRTQYADRVTSEAPLFTLLAALISLFFLYITFRARRAVLLPTLIVGLGILWTIGLIALFNHRLNIVTSILPALLVIIGMASAIHLSTKYFDQFWLLGNQKDALVQTIRTVGLSTFLACLTTAIGFLVLMLSGSQLLAVFGKYAAAGIMILYGLSITLIPLAFASSKPPKTEGPRLATSPHLMRLFDGLSGFTERHAWSVLFVSALLMTAGIVGITRISTDIFVFSDFYEDDPLRHDLAVFEKNYGGILPMEIIIEAQTPGQFRSLANIRKLDALQRQLETLAPIGRTLAIPNLVKLANQAYFGGHPQAHRLPTTFEMPFLQTALRDFFNGTSTTDVTQRLPRLVDSTFSIARVNAGVLDIGTTQMNMLADSVQARVEALFPSDTFDILISGTAIVTTRSGENLVRNLLVSLAAALLLISVLMALLFRSLRLMAISLLPNIIPLLVVGGAMGFGGILLKPSTALIFSIAFGIAVDNTIHFLAKYRLHRNAGMLLNDAVHTTLRETGKAILFTSLVLTSGFLVFTLSSFGGTVNMGALTALTLFVAMIANLLLLPALLYRFAPVEHVTLLSTPPVPANGHAETMRVPGNISQSNVH